MTTLRDSTDSLTSLLSRDDLFAHLAPAQLARVLAQLEPFACAAGQTMASAGSPPDGLVWLTQGAAQVTTPSQMTRIGPGARFGEEALSGLIFACDIVAVTPVQGWKLPVSKIQATQLTDPEVALKAAHAVVQRLAVVRENDRDSYSSKFRKLQKAKGTSLKELIGWLILLIAPPTLFFTGQSMELSQQAAIFMAILSGVIVMWVFKLVAEFIPPVIAMVATCFIGLAPASVAMGGFSSPSLMTLLGVFGLACVLSQSGLSYRALIFLLMRIPDRPLWHQGTLLGGGFFLSALVPSASSRLALMFPMFKDMVDGLRLAPRAAAATVLLASTFAGATLLAPMMATGKSSNIAGINLLPPQMQEDFLGFYWLAGAAASAVFLIMMHLVIARFMFPEMDQLPLPKDRMKQQMVMLGPLSRQEKIAMWGLSFFLLGMTTASLHKVQPSWLAGCLLVGLLVSGGLSQKDFQRQLDWPMIFLSLGMDSIVRVMNYLGIGNLMADALRPAFSFVNANPYLFVCAAMGVTLLLRFVLLGSACMLTSIIILLPVATQYGFHPWAVVFLSALFTDVWFARYQNGGYQQAASQGLLSLVDEQRFRRYHLYLNLARMGAGFVAVPWLQWLGLL